jgi:hypothetical protein
MRWFPVSAAVVAGLSVAVSAAAQPARKAEHYVLALSSTLPNQAA